MIAIALLLGAQAVPQTLLAAADDANGTYVQCLFATSRAASGAHLSVEAFERKLAGACHAEEEAAVRTGTVVLVARGEADAGSDMSRLAKDARQTVLDTYRKIVELSGQPGGSG